MLQHAEKPLRTETYDGTGQITHPDILYFPEGVKAGLSDTYKFLMANTPYPYDSTRKENPCIIVSKQPNGDFTQDKIPNPIALRDAEGHLSDVDLVFHKRVFWLFYRHDIAYGPRRGSKEPRSCELRLSFSGDLINWIPETLTGVPAGRYAVSPAVLYDPDDMLWKMWLVNSVESRKVEYYESNNGLNWFKKADTNIPFAWHIDVQKTKNSKKYYMLLCSKSYSGLFWAESNDGIDWNLKEKPILDKREGWNSRRSYRASFLIVDGKLMVWYSGQSHEKEWHVGFTQTTFKDEETLNVIR